MSLVILGSTGSVGEQAIDVAENLKINISGLCCQRDIAKLESQARKLNPKAIAVGDDKLYLSLKNSLFDKNIKIYSGEDGICEMIADLNADIALNAISGIAGLRPTLAAIENNYNIALANKESLVAGGRLVMENAKSRGVKILPVDSEHSAIFQCINIANPESVSRLILTASGGPFFGKKIEDTVDITPAQALNHPTWKMGRRITIDSSTLINKGFEVIEAAYLFNISAENIEVVIHRESIIHSMVEYIDNACIAQLSVPDMRLCINYALTYPKRHKGMTSRLNLAEIGRLSFFEPDYINFPLLGLAYKVLNRSDNARIALNAADEIAVELFLNNKIKYNNIAEIVCEVVEAISENNYNNYLEIAEADSAAREEAKQIADKYF